MPASSMCSITPPRKSSSPSKMRVDVDLDRVVDEPVDQHRVLRADRGRAADVAARARRRRRRSPCRGRRGRTTGAPAPGSRSRRRSPGPRRTTSPCRAWAPGSPASCSTRPNAPRSSARWIAAGRGADDRDAGVGEPLRQAERGLAAELADHPGDRAGLPLGVHDLEHVLQRERLEVEPVGGVVVGRHGLGVAVDHDRLVAGLGQRQRRVHAGVVELDALPDPVRPGAEDDHGLLARGARPRSPRRRTSSGTAWPRRTRRRRCRRSCRPAGCPARAGRRARRRRVMPRILPICVVGEAVPLGAAQQVGGRARRPR